MVKELLPTSDGLPDFYWWDTPNDMAHLYVFTVVRKLLDDQKYRQTENLQHFRLYNDENYEGLGPGGVIRPLNASVDRRRVTFNVVKSMCDTISAKIAKNRPKATFLTSGGDWAQQRKAKLLDKFCQGQFYGADIYSETPKVFLDSCVFGTGCMKIYEGPDGIEAKRVFPAELVIDENESYYGEPRSLFQTKRMARDVCKGMFPEHKTALDRTMEAKDDNVSRQTRVEEQIEIIEAWHLPSVEGASDGKHIICANNVTLLEEDWDYDYFPFVWLKWSDRLFGFWGKGLAEELIGIQLEINKLLQNIQLQMHLATPKVIVEAGSKIADAHLSNEIWSVLEFTGTKPDFFVPKTVSGEVFSHLDRLFERAYEISGVSQLAAQSKKPAGLESGVALREFQDIESERFVIISQKYEQLFLDTARQMIGLAREISERGDEYKVISHGDKDIEQVDWKDVNLEEEEYVMKIYPTSLLPTTPAAKLQSVIDLSQSGLIQDPAILLKLLEFPDIQAVTSLMTADIDIIDDIITKIQVDGEMTPPEPYMNLGLCIRRVQQAYNRAKLDNLPENRLELMRIFLAQCQKLLADMAMAGQMGMPTGPMPQTNPDMPAPPPGMGEPGMMGAPLGPEAGIPMAGGPPQGPPMPAGPGGDGPPPDLLAQLGQG